MIKGRVTVALIDSGASSSFIDREYAEIIGIPLKQLPNTIPVKTIDGSDLKDGDVTHCTVPVEIETCLGPEKICFYVITTHRQAIVLGAPWLAKHNPDIDWRQRKVKLPNRHPDPANQRPQVSCNLIQPDISCSDADIPSPPNLTCDDVRDKVSIPKPFSNFADVFDKAILDSLPPHRHYDCAIDLEPGKQPPFGPIYPLSEPEAAALREFLDENLPKGFVSESSSPAGAPVLFVRKKDGSRRLCVDYRGLNAVTIRNRYPLPLINQLLDRLRSAKVFTRIDLRSAYYLLRVRKGDEWKTAFRTPFGHFQFNVMPFGLTNAPATFQHFLNDIFRPFLEQFVIIYLDDILVFSKNASDHEIHVLKVLQILRDHNLCAKLEKCEFSTFQTEFLGYIVSSSGISMDPSKVKAVTEWPSPKNVKGVQSFLGFANFYRRFIENFSAIVRPLTILTRKGIFFLWQAEQEEAFTTLKKAFTTAPILIHADPSKPYTLETDASNFAIGAILSQPDAEGVLHPCCFFSRSLNPAESRYDIRDKELLAIKASCSAWRHYLEGAPCPITVPTDHESLRYFQTMKSLSSRQARWSLFFSRFNLVFCYRPGSRNGKADALSRRQDLESAQPCVVATPMFRADAFLASAPVPDPAPVPGPVPVPARIPATPLSLLSIQGSNGLLSPEFYSRLIEATSKDDYAQSRISEVGSNPDFSFTGQTLLFRNRIYVPDLDDCRLVILRSCHDSPTAGHFGCARTLELVKRNYWWPGLGSFVKLYVRSCDVCARAKASRQKPAGLLQPLSVPSHPFSSVGLDFITDLPDSNGSNCILVFVDRLTKTGHFVPCHGPPDAVTTADIFLSTIVRLYGIPDQIISDRGPQFISKFWTRLFELLGADVSLTSGYHCQTNGQTERLNQVLEQYLRCYTSYRQNDWSHLLPLAEFSYNNSQHSATNLSPFFALRGYHPKFDPAVPSTAQVPRAESYVKNITELHAWLRNQISTAQARYQEYADRHRAPAPTYSVDDLVWLSTSNITSARPCPKLSSRNIGPFPIKRVLSPVTVHLDLPPTMKIHPVFHVSLLTPHVPNTIQHRVQRPLHPVFVDNDPALTPHYLVNAILDSRYYRSALQYLIDWKGYAPADRSWEPADVIVQDVPTLVAQFHQSHPDLPGPAFKEPSRSRASRIRSSRRGVMS
jgi:hypothetical protein